MAYQKNSIFRFFAIVVFLLSITASNAWSTQISMNSLEGLVMGTICGSCKYSGKVCQANLKYIAGLSETGNYDLSKEPISKNAYNIKTVTFQSLETTGDFEFPNAQQNGNRNISGLLAMPDTTGPIKGMLVYFHGTIFSKNQTPSVQTNSIYHAVAGIFAASNYAVLFPDYPGLGSDSDNVHPYVLYPQQIVRGAIYLLNAAVPILSQKYGPISQSNPLHLMSNGYSEGGAYGVWFGACNTESLKGQLTYCTKNLRLDPSYKIVAITGSEGAYDTAGVIKDFLLEEVSDSGSNPFKVVTKAIVNSGKPGLASLAILSYATYNPNPFLFKSTLLSGFYNMQCSAYEIPGSWCNIAGSHMNLEQALSLKESHSGAILQGILFSAFAKSNEGYNYIGNKLTANLVTLFTSSKNSLYSLINKDVLITENFFSALSDSTIVQYGNVSPYPVFVFSLQLDSMVSPVNAYNFITHNDSGNVQSYFLDNANWQSCPKGEQIKTANVDHLGGYVVSHLFVLHYLEQVMSKIKPTLSTPLNEL